MTKKRKKPSVGRQVNSLVAELEIETASAEDVQAAADRVCALGREAVQGLAGGILRPGPARREKVAAMLGCLRGKHAMWAAEQIEALIGSRRLGPMERVWLVATARGLRETDPAAAPAERRPDAAEEPGAEQVDADELMLWREELGELPPQQRLGLVAPLLESGEPAFLPVLDVALGLGDPALDAAIAEGLARFTTPEALPLLRDLLRRPEPVVRRRARDSLIALAEHGVAAGDIFTAAPGVDDSRSRAFATEQDTAGTVFVAVAGRGAEGLWHCVVVVLDPVETGIHEAWGEGGLTETELRARLGWLAEDHGVDLHPTDLNVARALVAAGEDYARRQGHGLPPEYVIWRRRVGRPAGRPALPVAFGPACTECGARVRQDDIERGGLVAGDLALCADCAGASRSCARCGRAIHHIFDEYVVRRGQGAGTIDFVCRACDQASRQRP